MFNTLRSTISGHLPTQTIECVLYMIDKLEQLKPQWYICAEAHYNTEDYNKSSFTIKIRISQDSFFAIKFMNNDIWCNDLIFPLNPKTIDNLIHDMCEFPLDDPSQITHIVYKCM